MGTLTSGVGLVSGLDINKIVGQLVELERRPIAVFQSRLDQSTTIRSTLQGISTSLTRLKLTASRLNASQSFAGRTANASDPSIVATAGPKASIGSFSVVAKRLVSSHQALADGFESESSLVGAGTLKIANGGFVDRDQRLATLNGGAGVRAGSIRITDSAGRSTTIDLAGAVTVRDVTDAINSAGGISVSASVDGAKFKLTDSAGGAGALQVQDVAGSATATDLGLTTLTGGAGVYTGSDVYKLGANLRLDLLNDGNGVRNARGLADFRVDAGGGFSFDVVVHGAKTVGEVVDRINGHANNTGGRIQASLDGNRLQIVDTASGNALSITALNASKAARDLGIEKTTAASTLTGDNAIGHLRSVLLRSLSGGAGVSGGVIAVNGVHVDLSQANTLQDVIKGINQAGVAGVSAAVNSARSGITIHKSTAGALEVQDISGSLASGLNIAVTAGQGKSSVNSGDRVVKYISENTRLTSLNGGAGVSSGSFRIIDGNGASASVDISALVAGGSVGDVLQNINSRGLAINARINETGDGILLERTAGTGSLQVLEENGGSVAKSLRLLGTSTGAQIDGSFATTITLSGTDKLSDVVTKLQQASAPVVASILNDGSLLTPARLSVSSRSSGSAGELLLDGGATALKFADVSRAKDAVLLLGASSDGGVVTQLVSQTNAFNNVTPGLSIDIRQVSSQSTTVNVAQNQDGIVDAVLAFAKDYNAIRTAINSASTFNPDTFAKGPLFTDGQTRSLYSRLSGLVQATVVNGAGAYSTAGSLGISIDGEGNIAVDEGKLRSALQKDSTNVERFFANKTTGLVDLTTSLVDSLLDSSNGTLTNRLQAIERTITTGSKTIEDLNVRLELKRSRLQRQFYNMELALSRFQTQQQAIGRLTNSFASSTSTSSK